MTGTPYRGKSIPIYGENEIFKRRDVHIPMSWLIENKFLAKPQFGLNTTESFNFSHLNVNGMGKYNGKELQKVVDSQERLTAEIMREIVATVRNGRQGAFIFCSTIPHCFEALKALPPDESRIVIGDTPHEERKQIMEDAHNGQVNYLISVSCLLAGVDQPRFDVACFCRPTESLTLYIQAIGRVLRLHPTKINGALVLDHAGNAQRFQDIDDPIINEAIQPREENEKDYCIPCFTCGVQNTIWTRRCIGVHNGNRCDHFFTFKECHVCSVLNDQCSRHCRSCDAELIDPNAKLNRNNQTITVAIVKGEYWVTAMKGGFPIINCRYYAASGWNYTELFYTNTDKSRNILYAKFCRQHINGPSEYYMKLSDYRIMLGMIEKGVKTPHSIVVIHNPDGSYKLIKKLFD